MAMIKTDYGLVYNDDGSLCITWRNDIQFQNVLSRAVETETTNLIDYNNDIPTTTESSYIKQTDYEYKIDTSSVVVPHIFSFNSKTFTESPITISFYLSKLSNISIIRFNLYNTITALNELEAFFELTTQTLNIITGINGGVIDTGDYWRIYITANVTIGDTFNLDFVLEEESKNFVVKKVQLEQKSFASSFVNGSRINGKLTLSIDKLGFNPATDNWVITYRKYPIATQDNSLTGQDISSIGYNTVDNSQGYISWGKPSLNNVFRINVVYDDFTTGYAESQIFDPNWYFNNWHYIVILKSNNEIQYWIDNTLQCNLILEKPLLNNFTFGLDIGGDSGVNPNNSLISNITKGGYSNRWTPEYIQEIYQMNKPFIIPPKPYVQ